MKGPYASDMSFAYDSFGRLLSMKYPQDGEVVTYGYDRGGGVFSDDVSGNQSGWVFRGSDTRKVTWDEEDRVKVINQNGQDISKVLYGPDGERTNHLTQGEETIYFNQYLTIRNPQYPTKHIVVDGTMIADKISGLVRILFWRAISRGATAVCSCRTTSGCTRMRGTTPFGTGISMAEQFLLLSPVARWFLGSGAGGRVCCAAGSSAQHVRCVGKRV